MSICLIELGSVVDIVMGQAPPGADCNKDGVGTVFVKAGEFQEHSPAIREWTTQPLKLALPGDSLVCVVGATSGKVNYSKFECAIGRSVAAVRPKANQLEPAFLFQFLRTKIEQLRDRSQGAAQGVITREMLQSLRLLLPSPPEQRRIAAILDKADALRSKRREALAQLDRLAQSIFVEMFGDLFLNTKAYPAARLGDVCDVRDGTHDSPSYTQEGFPLITSKNIRNGQIDFSDVNFISETDYIEINRRSKVDMGDILMPMIGTIGNPALVTIQPEFAIKNMALIKFRGDSPTREFIFQFLRSNCFDRLVAGKNKGGTQKFLALGEIRALPVPIPPRALQREFEQRIQFIKNLSHKYEQAATASGSLFSSLQYRAFRGEL